MALADEIALHREELIALMFPHVYKVEGSSDDEVRQYLDGFLRLISDASLGRFEVRDDYLDTIIPACKRGGLPLHGVMESLIVTSMALMSVLEKEHHAFLLDFCRDYMRRMVLTWEAA
jgi:hypothetical protein